MEGRELIVSQRDLHRMHVVRLTLDGRESVQRGAELLGISARQAKRLRKKMREGGAQGLLHGNRGWRPWNRTVVQTIKKVLQLAQGRYKGLNDMHLTEKLNEKESVKLSRQTIRRILRQGGVAAARKHRPKRHYKRRERKAQEGVHQRYISGTGCETKGGVTNGYSSNRLPSRWRPHFLSSTSLRSVRP